MHVAAPLKPAAVELTSRRSGLVLGVSWSDEQPAWLTLRLPEQAPLAQPSQPLVEALTAGQGRDWSGQRLVATSIGARLRYVSHVTKRSGSWQTLWLTQLDETTGLEFASQLTVHDDLAGVRGVTHVRNAGSGPVTLHAVTSLVFSDFGCPTPSAVDAMTLLRGRSDWLAEGRWVESGLRAAGLPRLTYPGRPFRTRGCIEASSLSSWSTAYELPAGVLADPATGRRWSFQVEHNGSWLWQVGELSDGLYVALLGPTDEHHQWQLCLEPGDMFETVAASVALEPAAPPLSLTALTDFRRASRAFQAADRPLPVVFNDYMNTVKGNPSAHVLRPLVDAAAEAGADCFVIDAGWYAEDGDWWDTVGEWQPSRRRFPEGLEEILDRIRSRGMVAGLWLEPEVVGVNSPVAVKLPDSAFMQRDGVRVVDDGRYHLDFTDVAAVEFLDEVVDRLVNDYRVGYFKFDYNIRAGVGSDAAVPSPGHGLLRHNRAYLSWVDALRRRHPGLLLENCASGGMREDFATLSRFDLQSTSDQEEFSAYAPVAAAAPMLVAPEQAANWAYPQPGMAEDEMVFTLATAVLGRLYLSGWLNQMDGGQRALVADAVSAHKRLLPRLTHTTPFWPLGLPGWDDEWVALGLHDPAPSGHQLHLTVWRRAGQPGRRTVALPPAPAGQRWSAPLPVFPATSPLSLHLAEGGDALVAVDETGLLAARVVTLRAESAQ